MRPARKRAVQAALLVGVITAMLAALSPQLLESARAAQPGKPIVGDIYFSPT
ncbi:MAG: hypothetical protein QN198_00620 [Armatimonadota bacterium]|nr:hypothetical protein [Armatimonadota bacterium]MDR5702085.1 hypothetical protein [Armatimonadota bacterium]